MPLCHVALGGNEGDVAATFGHALAQLAAHPGVRVASRSRWYRTVAVGATDSPAYLNGVVALDTDLAPLELLDVLQRVEHDHGRQRHALWDARPLDLDLILYGDTLLDTPRLIVPHPAAWYRRFVLDPLCDIAPDRIHPERGVSIAHLRDRLLRTPFVVEFAPASHPFAEPLRDMIRREFPAVHLRNGSDDPAAAAADQSRTATPHGKPSGTDATLIAWLGRVSPQGETLAAGGPRSTLPPLPHAEPSTSASPPHAWQTLPRIARLDLAQSPWPPLAHLRHTLQAALATPTPVI